MKIESESIPWQRSFNWYRILLEQPQTGTPPIIAVRPRVLHNFIDRFFYIIIRFLVIERKQGKKTFSLASQTFVSDGLKKRFVKDFSLPIPVVKSPYFDYYIEMYDGLFKTKEKYLMMLAEIKVINGTIFYNR